MSIITAIARFLLLVLIFFSSLGFSHEFHWFQLMGDNRLWFRVVGDGLADCPDIVVDGETKKMSDYSEKTNAFPKSCFFELDLTNLPRSVVFNSRDITPRINTNSVKKIAIIGDTGCRIKGFFLQDCEKKWFFQEVIGRIVEHSPDIVIHVGDYIYREKGYKDDWNTWLLDFFVPAVRLLDSNIPLLLVRGNHESCARNGSGWFALLGRENRECQDYEKPYTIDVNGIEFVVTDSTYGENLLTDLEELNSNPNTKKSWILTHRPIVFRNKAHIPVGHIEFAKKLKKEIELFISGHIHAAQFLELDDRFQLISGNGGTTLSHMTASHSEDSRLEHGFAIIDFLDDRVKITSYDRFNNEMMSTYLPMRSKAFTT